MIGRDHRKLLALDGVYAFTGIICRMVRAPDTNLPYRDTTVSASSPMVADLERAFARVWDESGTPLPDWERPRVEDILRAGETDARVVAQEPRQLRTLDLMMTVRLGFAWLLFGSKFATEG